MKTRKEIATDCLESVKYHLFEDGTGYQDEHALESIESALEEYSPKYVVDDFKIQEQNKEPIIVHDATENNIMFYIKAIPVLEFKENGDIYVKGKLCENDKDVVYQLREFLMLSRAI